MVLEKKIFKGFYHIWAWQPSWSMSRDHFCDLSFPPTSGGSTLNLSNIGPEASEEKSFEIPTFFPYKCMVSIEMHREANLTSPSKGQTSMYNNYFSKFGRPLVPDDLCKDTAPRHPQFWRSRFLKVFTIYGHGSHLGQRTATILAIFRSPNLRRLHMKFEQNWFSSFRGEVV